MLKIGQIRSVGHVQQIAIRGQIMKSLWAILDITMNFGRWVEEMRKCVEENLPCDMILIKIVYVPSLSL